MRYLLLILLIPMTASAQLDTTTRGSLTQFTSNGLTYGVYIPVGWNAGDSLSQAHVAFYGNSETGSSAGYLDNYTPYRWMTSFSQYFSLYGAWNGRVVRSSGDTAKIAFLLIPNLDNSGGSPSKYAAAWTQFVKGLRMDTTNKNRFHGSAISGGPARAINAMCLSSDTSYAYMRLIDKFVFMSPTNIGQSESTIRSHLRGSRYLVWFASNDGNTGTPPIRSYQLYDKLPITGYKKIDSMATGGHTRTTWDSCMTIYNHNISSGGTAATNRWRMLVGDGFSSNLTPSANAGSDQSIAFNATLTLSGSGSDPDGTISAYQWSKLSGPSATITSPTSASTTVTGFSAGTYVFQLIVTDNNGATAADNVTITVTGGNQPPTVAAGDDKVIYLPTNTTSLSAIASDPDGSISTYLWTKVSGPSGGTITSASAATTTITALQYGTYTYTITVTDNGGASDVDEILVIVYDEIAPPIIFRGRKPIIQ